MTRGAEMSKLEAASRIVEIQGSLSRDFLGSEKREALMAEQSNLWDRHFLGRPYDEIAKDAWMHRTMFKWG